MHTVRDDRLLWVLAQTRRRSVMEAECCRLSSLLCDTFCGICGLPPAVRLKTDTERLSLRFQLEVVEEEQKGNKGKKIS